MKRLFLLATAAIFASMAPSFAQVKLDKEGIQKKIEKSDSDIQDAKKNAKPAVWLERGKTFVEAATAPTAGVFRGMGKNEALLLFNPKAKEASDTLNGNTYQTINFPNFVAFMGPDDKVQFWRQKTFIDKDAPVKARSAYEKAYEVDKKSASKVMEGMIALANYYKQDADNVYSMGNFKLAGDDFKAAYQVQMHPTINIVDTAAVYNAGFVYTVAQQWTSALECLEIAKGYNYTNDGDLYYYMFHCYHGLNQDAKAKDILVEGIQKFPGNNRIVEGLIGIYTITGEDPKEIIPMVEKAIEGEPNNIELIAGLGRIYDKLGDMPKAIESFKRTVDIAPNEFSTNFNLGLLYIKHGDVMNQDWNSKPFTSEQANTEMLAKINGEYAKSIPYLEKAHEVNPAEPTTVELLKNVSFRLLDQPGMNDMYKKYNEKLKELKGN